MAKGIREADIAIFAGLSATESAEKVLGAIRKFFPDAEKVIDDTGGISCVSTDASTLRDAIFGRRILDTVRSVLLSNLHGGRTASLELNRQAAAAGKLSLDAGGGALGPIVVRIQSPDMEGFIDWLAPRTEKGRPVENHVH